MSKPSGRKPKDTTAEAAAVEQRPVPSGEEVAQLLADMDDPSKWVEEDVMLGPGFYRAPSVARQLAEVITAYRAERGLSQQQLARLIALDQRLVAYIESGEHTPELETLVRLARHLGLSFTVRVTSAGAELSADMATITSSPATLHVAHEYARPATESAPADGIA